MAVETVRALTPEIPGKGSMVSALPTSDAPNPKPRPRFLYCALFLGICSLLVAYLHQGSHSPFITCGQPDLGKTQNPSYAYSYYYNGDLLHKENFYPMELVEGFKNGTPGEPGGKLTFAKRRVYYSFLGNLFTPFLNLNFAFKFLNLLLVFVTALLVLRFSEQVFESRRIGLLAALLFLLSSPATVFVGDLSPHILSLAFYILFANLLLPYWNGIHSTARLLGLMALFGIWALTYSNVFYALLVFGVACVRRRRWHDGALLTAAIFGSSLLQEKIVESFGVSFAIAKEMFVLKWSFKDQLAVLTNDGIGTYFHVLVQAALDYILGDNPIVVIIGLMGLAAYRGRYRLLLLALCAAPLVATLPFFRAAGARGYIASSLLLLLYPTCAALLARLWVAHPFSNSERRAAFYVFLGFSIACWFFTTRWNALFVTGLTGLVVVAMSATMLGPLRSRSIRHLLAGTCLASALLTQGWWNYAHYDLRPVPANSFIYGLLRQVGSPTDEFQHRDIPFYFRSHFLPYSSDVESVPRSLGGTKSWSEFVEALPQEEATQIFPKQHLQPSLLLQNPEQLLGSLFQQSLMLLLTIIALLLLTPSRGTGMLSAAILVGLFVASTFYGSSDAKRDDATFLLDQLIVLQGDQELRGEVEISPEFVAALQAATASGTVTDVDIFFKMSKLKRAEGVTLQLFTAEVDRQFQRPVPRLPIISTIPAAEFLELLEIHERRIPFSLKVIGPSERRSVYIGSWMRAELLTKRRGELLLPDGSQKALEFFPAIEIRGRTPTNEAPLVGL
ncbi:MAG: hypothetical protein KDD69_01700 [Bdellovibrionales bacterium]|nr:hypothetical protein [Bdellovibrionales bacterium]